MRTIHFIGICGTGMGAFAGLARRAGYRVRGSDQAVYPPMSEKLAAWGIEVRSPYDASNLDPVPDRVVIGNAIRRTNPEARAVLERGLSYTSFPAALSEMFLDDRHVIVVAGTHGKTTTSSLVAHLLFEAGLDPSFLIGGIPTNFGESFRLGSGRYFVVEGDEYDTAFFDKRPKFVHYQPTTLVLTSLEYDHADIYPDVESIERAFDAVVELVPDDGLLVACRSAPRVMARLDRSRAPTRTYGLASHRTGDGDADRVAASVRFGPDGASFTTRYAGRAESFSLDTSGAHNVENALAALTVAESLGIPVDAARSALSTFRGVARRQTVRDVVEGVRVVDDFAHHPTAVDRTLAGLRDRYPDGRLFAVFEPRTATSARAVFHEAYVVAFDAADAVLIAPVGRPELSPHERLDTERLASDVRERGTEAEAFDSLDAIILRLVERTRPGDTVVFMSNGGFGDIHDRTIAALARR